MTGALLTAVNLSRSYAAGRAGWFRRPSRFLAVADVSLQVRRGETIGIVGESGCGKSTLSRLLLGLAPTETGTVTFDGTDLATLSTPAWRALRARLQLVFQDTGASLDPRLPIRAQVREPLDIHRHPAAEARCREMLEQVRLGAHLWDRYPHELSGGQVQRVIIARALALGPDLLVLDEPVSALDVSIRAQIVNLLGDLQRDLGLAYVFVSHDLGVVRHVADRVYVMYLGRVVEHAPKAALFTAPRHPYTTALLAAIPAPDPAAPRHRSLLQGDPPSPQAPPSGCPFHPRCPHAIPRCVTQAPALRPFGTHDVACHRAQDLVPARPAPRSEYA
ncbi:MAG: ATP-binding cassette domain-containing protein [Pseudorhodobacter sp.]|nr:ATP-binding cassette domain-containing protein [Pseudorhodobacter sp.]